MKITEITEKNIDYFRGGIEEYYRSGDAGRMCFGLIDDDDNAVGTAVLDSEPSDAAIRYFAIDDAHRKKGYGRFFMEEIVKSLNPVLFSRISFCEFSESDDLSGAMGFLSHCGFTIDRGVTRRNLYDMDSVCDARPFGKGRLPAGQRLIRGAAADEKLRTRITEIAERLESDQGYLDAGFLLSMKNRYGGIIVSGEEIKAILGAERFGDGARLVSIYIGQGTTEELLYLFDYALDAVKMEAEPLKTLYIDTSGDKLQKFEDALMKRKSVNLRESLTDKIAWRSIG